MPAAATTIDIMPFVVIIFGCVASAFGWLIANLLSRTNGGIDKLGASIDALRVELQTHGNRLERLETKCKMEHGEK